MLWHRPLLLAVNLREDCTWQNKCPHNDDRCGMEVLKLLNCPYPTAAAVRVGRRSFSVQQVEERERDDGARRRVVGLGSDVFLWTSCSFECPPITRNTSSETAPHPSSVRRLALAALPVGATHLPAHQ